MRVCTIIAKNYVAFARVLARSFAEHHPASEISVFVIDDLDGYINPADEPFEILTPSDIECEEFELMASRYDVLELSTAVKPWLLRALLSRGEQAVTYLDPDIRVFGSLGKLEQAALEHGLTLIPHNTVPMPFDGQRPSQVDIMIAGVFNLGYIGLAPGVEIDRLLDWWSDRLRRDCRVDPVYGYFVDQRWMDLVPGLVSDYAVIRDPEFNVAYWNLHARALVFEGDRYTVEGRPLAFFHFSGFDPDRPDQLSRHQTRFILAEHPDLRRICSEYADALKANGHPMARNWPYSYGHLADGTPFTKELRRLFLEGEERGELHFSPLEEKGCAAFRDWLVGQEEGAPPGISRLLGWLYRQRDDAQRAFPDVAGAHRDTYLRWAQDIGIRELGLPPDLAAPVPRRPRAPTVADGMPGDPPVETAGPDVPEFGVNVVGYFRSELGVGEAARQVVGALDAAGVPLLPLHGATIPLNRQGHPFTHLDHGDARYPLNLICMNADALPEFAQQAGRRFFDGRYSIGLWFWEVSEPPEAGWVEAFSLLDEVWVASKHVAHAVASVSPIPTIRIPLPVELPPPPPMSRADLGLPEEDFIFLFSFDYLSLFERKNPLAVVRAFRSAFEPGSGATLVLKCINPERDERNRASLREAVAGRPDIQLIEHYLAPEAKNALTAACDCYVSLHRSEGFGLTMAEAMFLGKPVIATGYSGNLDFMNEGNSYLVDSEMTKIGTDAAPYPSGGEWAEPSVEHAAALMRTVFDDPDAARERGRIATTDIRLTHSPQAAGHQMMLRLHRARAIAVAEGRAAFRDSRARVTALARRVAAGPMPAPAPTLARKAVRRAVMRTIQPFTAYQLPVNADVADVLEQADEQLREIRRVQLRADSDRLRAHRLALDEFATLRGPLIDLARRVERIEAEAHAVPFVQGTPFAATRDPIAGLVLGYSQHSGDGSADAYRAFEDVFRGSEEFIRDRQRRYLALIGGRRPVLDFGCGRGEMLDLLRDAGIPYLGVDSDPGMVARCHDKSHSGVVNADGLEYLAQQAHGSLGAIFCAQVIEHLPQAQLRELFSLARRKLSPDGVLIAETVNPHSPPALKTFWVDLTHQHPIFPEVALELCRESGFTSAYVFHPNGTGDFERDRFTQGEFAVVASLSGRAGSEGA